MEGIRLRQATEGDGEFAYRTKQAAMQAYVEQAWGEWDEAYQRELHERRFVAHLFRIVEVAGEDVGVLAMVREPDHLKLNQLFLLPEHQGKGIGAAVMRRLVEEHAVIRLTVLKVNVRAIAFYRRLGFEVTGETATHVRMERGAA